MTDTVLTNEEIMHLWDTRVGEPSSSFPLIGSDKRCFARAIESAVLQSPEIVAMRKDAERYRWATANEGNAETLNSIVICHNGDQAKINERVDVYRNACAAAEIGRRMKS